MALDSVDLLGVNVTSGSTRAVLAQIERRMHGAEPLFVAFANAHTLNLASSNADYRQVLNGADLVLNDGVGVAIAARMLNRHLPENLNGTDFMPHLLQLAARLGWGVYLLGGTVGTAEAAAHELSRQLPGLHIAGTHHGYLTPASSRQVVGAIRASGARVLLVGMGNPAQEFWLAGNLEASGAQLGLGVGAFLDFAAGRVVRAPAWMRRARLEWVWRLIGEPRRLGRRYLLGNPLFLMRAALYARRARVRPAG